MPHGQAANLVFSDDGTLLYAANQESDDTPTSALIINTASQLVTFGATPTDFLWNVAQKDGVVVFGRSFGNAVLCTVNPTTLASIAQWNGASPSHALGTDGTNIYAALESNPGALQIFTSALTPTSIIPANGNWTAGVYGMAIDTGTGTVYVGGPDGITAFQNGTAATFADSAGGMNVATAPNSGWVLRSNGAALEKWSSTGTLLGSWTAPGETVPNYGPLSTPGLGAIATDGTYAYVAYMQYEGTQAMGSSGFFACNVSGNAPTLVAQWKFPFPAHNVIGLALSPNGQTVAISQEYFGIAFVNVAIPSAPETVNTTITAGETRDAYVDVQGNVYEFLDYLIQATTPAGVRTGYYYDGNNHQGGWVLGPNGVILEPGAGNNGINAFTMAGGMIAQSWFYWDNEDAYCLAWDGSSTLYGCGKSGVIEYTITATGLTPVKTIAVGGTVNACLLDGTSLWLFGDGFGVAVLDTTMGTVTFTDSFTAQLNAFSQIIKIGPSVYVGCGSMGIRIYSETPAYVGSYTSVFPTWLDMVPWNDQELLAVCNYGDGVSTVHAPDNLQLLSVTNPAATTIAATWITDSNFRARWLNDAIQRCSLGGVETISIT